MGPDAYCVPVIAAKLHTGAHLSYREIIPHERGSVNQRVDSFIDLSNVVGF